MSYARIINNTALDVTSVNPALCFTPELAAQFEFLDVPGLRHGAQLIDGEWVNPPEPEPTQIEQVITVSSWALRRALNQMGLRATVEAAVAASTDQDLKDGWEYAGEFHSNNPMILDMCTSLNLSDQQRMDIFALAQSFT